MCSAVEYNMEYSVNWWTYTDRPESPKCKRYKSICALFWSKHTNKVEDCMYKFVVVYGKKSPTKKPCIPFQVVCLAS